ncbi:YlmC/YmxH family sporulation protein [Pullulanibacillus pueri]|uniref:PRC-barrel domain-containing protein n=1 Tax=Pullulanibacillus pueri TaxID=1437324 RepID=A0A8J2ZRF9_9BACL|nr:YlmC/YmxH family sporulation protein [Pullulanibacillus pueri]MBM7680146.1 YlmC/YmxH family sporulation protein [Pullulanibacillus pueri]GGH74573.1 hypothetical protein GCM10007096_02950 [Pullulanibacillus pueri]
MARISDFQVKEVVNVENGKLLGHIGDLDVNMTTGKIEHIVIPGAGKMLGLFGRESEVVIPWRNIVRVGDDVILVRFNEPNSGYDKAKESYE